MSAKDDPNPCRELTSDLLQKGERYVDATMAFSALSLAMDGQSTLPLTISYDVSCQFTKSLTHTIFPCSALRHHTLEDFSSYWAFRRQFRAYGWSGDRRCAESSEEELV
ncbi:hypothetical protein C8F04DRAFT_1255827 [Mycena alexandri]|uniref:Uncharacterized protein n=1 Tax=Mycena alexandri TaxID=1745969 RepID=A0AAD6T3C0_9AGAR|nr:hypothetical protein C8F04DRAFT_1255827 [Mycena alexandri]